MKDIVACMITVDRRLFGKENYLSVTLENLSRSGFFDDDRLATFGIFNSRPDCAWIKEALSAANPPKCVNLHSYALTACDNAGFALEYSGSTAGDWGCKWVLFMEDDLDFCSDFLGSVGRYLDLIDHKDRLFADISIPIIASGCPYPQVRDRYNDGHKYWAYSVEDFYGTQCFAIRPHDAISLGKYLQRNPTGRNPNEYDLMIHEWMRATYPDHKYFLASVPSFVEHIGRQSVCTDKEETHRNPSWMGRDWRFE